MHANQLVELGARIALLGPRLAQGTDRLSPAGVQKYWSASRKRFERWATSLDEYVPAAAATAIDPPTWTDVVRPLLEEVFTGELLVRIWTAVAISHARRDGITDLEPMLRSLLLNHLEIRNRALNCLVFGVGPDSHQIVEMQQVRRRVERWTDLLFGEMQRTIEVSELAFDPRRAKDYARTSRYDDGGDQAVRDAANEELVDAIRAAFETSTSGVSFSPQHNRQLTVSIIGCFHGDWLETLEWNRDQWRRRMEHATKDSQMWIQDLLSLDEP